MKVIEKVRETTRRLQAIARRKPKPPQVMQARVRAAVPATADDYDDDEPQTRLTSAFVVVLILHVIAVGGIYAFNQIKASRRPAETTAAAMTKSVEKTPTAAPAPKIEEETAPVSAPASAPVTRPRSYVVKQGDTLGGIAKSYGLSVADLKAWNSLAGDNIRPGQTLAFSAPARAAEPAPKPVETKPLTRTYTVKAGDRLIFIAKKYNVTPEDLIALNKIKDPARLQIGQTLKVPVKK
jgi:LysM repeat protein